MQVVTTIYTVYQIIAINENG